ncbi:hypothetical protein CHARACLAT_010057 [Characodon lateralis]|uniref:Uncharacterized protein n=1 Tax=Characodon lateralis TaxID=208331 RepID=A0ABU7CMF7_9TELE|nr:hypothetical protein [Characodon lateralis]
MATLTEKSTKERLLSVLDDLEVLSRELIEMLALSRGQKLPQPGEDTQVTETHWSKSVFSTSVTGRVCRAVLPGTRSFVASVRNGFINICSPTVPGSASSFFLFLNHGRGAVDYSANHGRCSEANASRHT